MADQLLHELREGIAVIPRLTFDYRDESRVILNWESGTAPLSVGSVESRATEDRGENFRKAMEGVLIDCSRVIEQELGNYEHVETKRIAVADQINRSFPEDSKDASVVSRRAMALRVIENALRETGGPTESSATGVHGHRDKRTAIPY